MEPQQKLILTPDIKMECVLEEEERNRDKEMDEMGESDKMEPQQELILLPDIKVECDQEEEEAKGHIEFTKGTSQSKIPASPNRGEEKELRVQADCPLQKKKMDEADEMELQQKLIFVPDVKVECDQEEEETMADTEVEECNPNVKSAVSTKEASDPVKPTDAAIKLLLKENNLPFKCTVCGKGFKRKGMLVYHIESHNDELKCDVCLKTFLYQSSLDTHRRTHTGERPYTCEICGKMFSRNSSLLRHNNIHTHNHSYKCEVCGKAFTQNSALVLHIRRHTGEMPYTCHFCGKLFSRRDHLVIHVRSHIGVRRYKCEVCGKCFTQKNVLIVHLRSHTGERPFVCKVCGRCFARTEGLARHSRNHPSVPDIKNISHQEPNKSEVSDSNLHSHPYPLACVKVEFDSPREDVCDTTT